MHSVVQVIPNDDYTVFVYFEDGRILCYDAKPLLSKDAFIKLSDIVFFKNACTVMNDTLAWDVSCTRDETRCIDIDPETLYSLEETTEMIA